MEVLAEELMSRVAAVVLTDDEICSISYAVKRPWPTPLATVDLSRHEALTAAVARGTRSLIARGILAADGGSDALVLATEPLRRSGVVTLGDVSADLTPVSDGVRVVVFERSNPECATWAILPGGLHSFAPGKRADVIAELAGLLAGRASGAAADPGSTAADLLITGRSSSGGSVGMVAGRVCRRLTDWDATTGQFGTAEPLPSVLATDPGWWQEAVAALWPSEESSGRPE